MSTTTHPGARPAGAFAARTLAQVNLLPPEVRAARGLTATKRVLGLALVGTVLLAGVGYGAARVTSASAADELATAQDATAVLQKEEAKYAEVPRVASLLKRTTDVRTSGMASEIQWKGYVDAISAVLPPNVSIDKLSVVQATVSLAAPAPADSLEPQGVATITFTSRSTTLPDGSAWIKALDSVPNFYGATYSTMTLGEVGGVVGYAMSSTVEVDAAAFANRFAATSKGN